MVAFLRSAFQRADWPEATVPEIAFVGRSNVGKSSCLNALAARWTRDAARVSRTPGRTQCINFFDHRHEGAALRLVDLPGYGFAKAPKSVQQQWDRLVGDYLHHRDPLVLVVILVDLRHDASPLDAHMVRWLAESGRTGLLVATKADRVPKNRRVHHLMQLCRGLEVPKEATLLFSATERIGVDELWQRIHEAVAGDEEEDGNTRGGGRS